MMGDGERTKLYIGLHRSHQRTLEGTTETNVVRGGPNQLLNWVETQLGLNGPDVAWTDRVVAYHQALMDSGGQSFAASLEADAWATASNLLRRRDELLLAGWNPNLHAGRPFVDDLAALEPFKGPVGLPERINTALGWLERGMDLPNHQALLDEDPSVWPTLWQRLLNHMNVEVRPTSKGRGEGSLATVQRNFVEQGDETVEVDYSLVALRAASRHSAVHFLAKWMSGRDVTVYCPDDTVAAMLDAALHADGQPTMGVRQSSRSRPAFQILPLVLQLLWKPVNPYVLLDFLMLPVGPVRRIAYRLARALEQQPGYQSDAWNKAIKKILEDDEDGKKGELIGKWLDHERVPIGEDLPTALVEQRCGFVSQWTSGRAEWELKEADEPDEDLASTLLIASRQASALGKLAAQLGSTISEAQLERLLDEIRDASGLHAPNPEQSGGAVFVSSLADVRETEHLVWLGTHAPERRGSAWTASEIKQFGRAGIELHPGPAQAALRSAEHEGLLQAKNLLVVDIEAIEGQRHPLWLRIHGNLKINGTEGNELPLLEHLLKAGDLGVASQEVAHTIAPATRVEWEANAPIPLPEYTSATALEDQITCPLKWTLRHALKIRHSDSANIPNDARLKGNFAHELMEHIFLPGPPPKPDEAASNAGRLFDELLPRNAAPLSIPRKLAERTRLRTDLIAAARHFAEALHKGRYEVVGIEVPTDAEFHNVPLYGRIDCVLRDSEGETIVDFKFGGQKHYEEKLTSGRALQLATYAHSRDGPVPGGAYFILGKNRILTPNAGAMRGASHVVEGPSVETTWTRLSEALVQASEWMTSGPVVARPIQEPSKWATGANLALDMDDPESACAYCDYDGLCGRRPLS